MDDRKTRRRRGIDAARVARHPLRSRALATAAVVALAGCGEVQGTSRQGDAGAPLCEVINRAASLPEELRETSGIAESRTRPGVYWSHNDSGRDPTLFGVGGDGRHLGRLIVTGAKNEDWEDIASGPCPDGGPACLYLADTGNNDKRRENVSLWVFPEPDPSVGATAPAVEYRARFPGEPTDIEALAVLPDGRILLVSKGSNDPVRLFRWPTPLRAGVEAVLEEVRELEPRPTQIGDRVTGASATPDGKWVAVRSYAALAFFRTDELLGEGGPTMQFDLDPLAEPQGESVALSNDGSAVLTTEGAGKFLPGTISSLHCLLPK
ncbi:MAG TPA: hypothetical protein VEX86_15215 [Longimicrobium sp.]|nr:hypothetical protein [Longimicrobium sp.]